MMWLLFLVVLAAGIWCNTDAAASIVDGLHTIQENDDNWTSKDKILMIARLIRGLFGWALLVVAFFLALGV